MHGEQFFAFCRHMWPVPTRRSRWTENGVEFTIFYYGRSRACLESRDRSRALLLRWWVYSPPGEPLDVSSLVGDYLMSFLERSYSRSNGRSSGSPPDDSTFLASYPALFEYLTASSVGEQARETSTVTLFVEDGRFKLWLNDRDRAQGACVSSGTFAEALDQLEEGLAEGGLDWRPAKKKR